MNRFEAASDGELQSFADNQKSLNTQRSTKTTMCLLEQYKVEAFNYTNGFETMDRNNLVKLLKSFYQKIKKSDGELVFESLWYSANLVLASTVL